MPTYYSVKGQQTLELRRGGYQEVDDPVLGRQKIPVKPMKLRFIELNPPFPVFGLPSRGGLARGTLSPEIGADQLRRAAQELGPTGDNLPESDEELAEWVRKKLSDHPMKGTLFVEVENADEVAPGQELGSNLEPPPGMVTSPVGVIVRSEKGGRAFCKACQKSVDARGINGHARSKKHLANLREMESEMKQASGF